MKVVIFFITITAEILSAVLVLLSIIAPKRKFWPPNHEPAWTGYLMVFLFVLSGLGLIITAVLDWGSIDLVPIIRWGAGFSLWIGGCALAAWAVLVAGLFTSFGKEGKLIQQGPYQISRNPQYLGFILGLIGWALVSSSRLTMFGAAAGVIPLILVPFAEEPWLKTIHGPSFEEYKKNVPRFLFRI